jgi:2-dehydro-3-deoxy-D-arabinonate dehydratase
MQIIRYAGPDGVRVGLLSSEPDGRGQHSDEGRRRLRGTPQARGQASVRPLPVPAIADLLALPLDRLREVAEAAAGAGPALRGDEVRLLPPVDGLTEVWAAGVTYQRSSSARQEESEVADVYARVYSAARPELFCKSAAWRVCGPGEPVGIRPDSAVNVPEPELAVVCTAAGQIAGVTICNDMSSRSIEGENPLYLPQAKVYTGACALGPGIVPAWELPDLGALAITATVRRAGAGQEEAVREGAVREGAVREGAAREGAARDGAAQEGSAREGSVAWQAAGSTAQLHRGLAELTQYLFRYASFPYGVVLSTGTGLVPELDFTLQPGDEVQIDIAGIGRLVNVVRPATAEWFGWLTPEPGRRPPG